MRRLLSGVGRTLITAGVLLLLFVAYQLWGTNIRQAQEQRKLKSGFESELEAAGIAPIEFDDVSTGTFASDTTPETTLAPPTTLPSPTTIARTLAPTSALATPSVPASAVPASVVPTPTTLPTPPTLPTVRAGRSKKKAPQPGRAVGLLVIPRIKQRQVIVEGTAKKDLESGPGRYSRSAFPGQPGNAAIAGHRTTFGAPFFNLGLLRPGDPIFIQTQQGKFRYDVIDACRPRCTGSGSFIVAPSDSSVLSPTPGQNVLTLTTCHPKYTAQKRLIVRAKLVGPAADADFFEAPAPPPTTAAPVITSAPTTVAVPVSVAESSAPADDPTVASTGATLDTAVASEASTPDTADTSEAAIGSEVVATDDILSAAAPSLLSERDPGGTGPVWTLGLFQGHRSTWAQTGLWSALCALIWFGCWRIARPRRLAAQAVIYSVGFAVLFLPALYFTFEVLSRLLPENL